MEEKRLYFLDYLKWFIIWLMVAFHAAICYMAYAPRDWYVLDPAQPLLAAAFFVRWADVFIMPVMFFVSGYFGLRSMTRYDACRFWKGKCFRIMVPWLFGVIFLSPLVVYSAWLSRGTEMGFGEFYRSMFLGDAFSQVCYWYLSALLVFYLLLAIFFRLSPKFWTRKESAVTPGGTFYGMLFLISLLGIGGLNYYTDLDAWASYWHILSLQTTRIPTHISMFFAGALAWKWRWFEEGGYSPAMGKWGGAFVLFSFFYLWQRFQFPHEGPGFGVPLWLNALSHGGLVVAATFFFLGGFHRFMNRSLPILPRVSKTSYAVYLVHQPILLYAELGLRGFPLNVYTKFLLACTLTLTVSHWLGCCVRSVMCSGSK